jgi:hypothetical protein
MEIVIFAPTAVQNVLIGTKIMFMNIIITIRKYHINIKACLTTLSQNAIHVDTVSY